MRHGRLKTIFHATISGSIREFKAKTRYKPFWKANVINHIRRIFNCYNVYIILLYNFSNFLFFYLSNSKRHGCWSNKTHNARINLREFFFSLLNSGITRIKLIETYNTTTYLFLLSDLKECVICKLKSRLSRVYFRHKFQD